MFSNLLRLYKQHSQKTPLEDFTTEALAGILNLDAELKKTFIEFLKLPEGNYSLTTQERYVIQGVELNCIVDMVVENESMICFIENKVDSQEGYRQLERYSLVLDELKQKSQNPKFETKLIYCTKYYDNKELKSHDFKQIRWFEVATDVLMNHDNNPFVKDFFNFLKTNRMAQELTFTALDFTTIQNMRNVVMIMNGHLEKSEAVFRDMFTEMKLDDSLKIEDIVGHNRLIRRTRSILGFTKYSELKFGFNFEIPVIYTGIYVEKSHPQYDHYKNIIALEKSVFSIAESTWGSSIELSRDISDLLNRKDVDDVISSWFKESFDRFGQFINRTQVKLPWTISVKPINTMAKLNDDVIIIDGGSSENETIYQG